MNPGSAEDRPRGSATGPEADASLFTELLDTPVYVVTTASVDGTRAGCLVGFGGPCSLNPPQFAVWLSRANHTYRAACRARYLALHLLPPAQTGLARHFGGQSGDWTDKFAGIAWSPGPGGVPVLAAATAWFVGRILHQSDRGAPRAGAGRGDHDLFVLAPAAAADATPLVRPRRGEHLMLSDTLGITPGHPA